VGASGRTARASAIGVDQGGEFISRDLDLWAYRKGVIRDFSGPGKPADNAFIESVNGKLRTECSNTHWFMSLDDAREKRRLGVETATRSDPTADRQQDTDFAAQRRIDAPADVSANSGIFQQ